MKHSTFYVEGAKVAMNLLGLTKTANPVSAGRMLLSGVGAGVARGAATGALTGGIGGAIAAPEGEGGSGFLRGMGYGALTGGAVGGAAGGLKTRAFQKAHPEYVNRTNKAVAKQTEPLQRAAMDMEGGPIPQQTTELLQRFRPAMEAHRGVMGRLQTGGLAGLAAGGAAGGIAGATTPQKGVVERAREELGI